MTDDSSDRNRRALLRALASTPVALIASRRLAAEENAYRETADLITGPFFPVGRPPEADADLTVLRGHRQRAAGQVVRLSGRVLNVRGEPVPHARIEIWQANAQGRYAHPSDPNTQAPLDPDFQGVASLRAGRDGSYAITTIKPGAYPTARGDWRAPHIHFQVEGRVDRKVSQLFFPGEPLNGQDRHLNSVRRPDTLLARVAPAGTGSVMVATWDIVLTTG